MSQKDQSTFEPFEGGGFRGEVASACRSGDVVDEVMRLVDPTASIETIHWGRNYIYAAKMNTPAGGIPVVVKQFKNQGLKKRVERHFRGSKAERSWRVAKELVRVGLATPVTLRASEPPPPSVLLAVSPHFYNDHTDLDRLLEDLVD